LLDGSFLNGSSIGPHSVALHGTPLLALLAALFFVERADRFGRDGQAVGFRSEKASKVEI
jgi:hypothetical protein